MWQVISHAITVLLSVVGVILFAFWFDGSTASYEVSEHEMRDEEGTYRLTICVGCDQEYYKIKYISGCATYLHLGWLKEGQSIAQPTDLASGESVLLGGPDFEIHPQKYEGLKEITVSAGGNLDHCDKSEKYHFTVQRGPSLIEKLGNRLAGE